jgi:hypothetical protein
LAITVGCWSSLVIVVRLVTVIWAPDTSRMM